MSGGHTPWVVVQSLIDPEMYAVQGVYLVANVLPIEDARLIAAAPDLLAALVEVRRVGDDKMAFRSEWVAAVAKADAVIARTKTGEGE